MLPKEGVRLVANPDTLAEYSISANPPIDTSTIVLNLIAITTDGLDQVKILVPAELAEDDVSDGEH